MFMSHLGYLDNDRLYVTRIRSNLKVSVKTLLLFLECIFVFRSIRKIAKSDC
jgi:hypothetical protein